MILSLPQLKAQENKILELNVNDPMAIGHPEIL